eukprot:3273767-Prymnesium_polylepis.1
MCPAGRPRMSDSRKTDPTPSVVTAEALAKVSDRPAKPQHAVSIGVFLVALCVAIAANRPSLDAASADEPQRQQTRAPAPPSASSDPRLSLFERLLALQPTPGVADAASVAAAAAALTTT